MPKNKSINLLPQEEFNSSTIGRVLKWATGTFRIIVIVTEIVVMAAFLSRFWLDTQNSNLNKIIKVKTGQILAQGELEKQFRSLQTKVDTYGKIAKIQNTTQILDKITGSIPTTITLSRIVIENKSINIRGYSLSDFDISNYINNLEGDLFKKVELKQLSSSESNFGGTNFVIDIEY